MTTQGLAAVFCARARVYLYSAAALLLSGAAAAEPIPALIQKFTSRDASARSEAAEALVKAGAPAVRPLLGAMKARRANALILFGRMGETAVPELLKALKDPQLAP